MTLALLVVHGIGEERTGYSTRLIGGVTEAMRAALQRLLSRPASPPQPLLVSEEALWDRHVNVPQQSLREFLNEQIPRLALSLNLRRFANAVLGRLLLKARARVAPFLEDILAYQRQDAQQLIHGELEDALQRLAAKRPSSNRPTPLTIVAHSLGTVIASDFLWDRWMKAQRLPGFRLENFFTMGSPIAFYALKYGRSRDAFDKPITVEPPGCWVNVYHPTDPIATPLRPLNEAYRQAVLQDVRIRNRHLIAAHTSYWADHHVHQLIGHKLALDWLRHQEALPVRRLSELDARYAQHLRIV